MSAASAPSDGVSDSAFADVAISGTMPAAARLPINPSRNVRLSMFRTLRSASSNEHSKPQCAGFAARSFSASAGRSGGLRTNMVAHLSPACADLQGSLARVALHQPALAVRVPPALRGGGGVVRESVLSSPCVSARKRAHSRPLEKVGSQLLSLRPHGQTKKAAISHRTGHSRIAVLPICFLRRTRRQNGEQAIEITL
jgi:hypothetical protein